MVRRVLPPRLDNHYEGYRVAIWILAVVVLLKTGVALNSIFNTRLVLQSADRIPVDTFTNGGAETVVGMFKALGLAHLVLGAFGVLALVRYRTMIPLMYVVLLLEQLARTWIWAANPIPRTGAGSGPYLTLVLVSLMAIGFALSVRRSPRPSLPAIG